MTNEIRLIDVLNGLEKENFTKQFPGCRRKLRFNVNWRAPAIDANGNKTTKLCSLKQMYLNKDPFFKPCLLSVGNEKRKRIQLSDVVFQFIEIEPHKWLFVGAYKITSMDATEWDPDFQEYFKYAGVPLLKLFESYNGRLIVKFTNLPQQFYYVSDDIIDNVVVDQILPEPYLAVADEFPGYENVCRDYMALKRCMKKSDWRDALSSVYGVYVLTDKNTGKQYVGSACGDDGIYGRWSVYLKKGYDDTDKEYPNKKLKDLVQKESIKYIENNFQYSIIEIFPKTDMGRKKALARENYWKNVLGTRNHGYNDN